MSGRKKATTPAGEVKKNKESQLMIKKGKKETMPNMSIYSILLLK